MIYVTVLTHMAASLNQVLPLGAAMSVIGDAAVSQTSFLFIGWNENAEPRSKTKP